LELKVKKASVQPVPSTNGTTGTGSQDPFSNRGTSASARNLAAAGALAGLAGTGASAAAGVLTAVDEDEEGGEEAAVPGEFEYWSDNEDGKMED
jgi:26S proteasome regulatory subunit N2